MTVAAIAPSVGYTETGNPATLYAVPFQFGASADLVVTRVVAGVETVLAGYSVTGSGPAGTASVQLAASVTGAALTIRRATARTQVLDLANRGDLPSAEIERALDRRAMVDQEQDAALAGLDLRLVKVQPGETGVVLPSIAARKGKVLGFHSETGLPIAVADDADEIAEDVAAAEAARAAAVEAAELARLNATQGLPRGRFVNLDELGLAGYPDFEGFVYYTDGEHLYPMLPVAECKAGWLHGGQFADNPDDGIYYASVNPSYMKDPTRQGGTVNTYIVKPGGSNAANGLTSGTAWATWAYANTTATRPAIIRVEADWVGSAMMGAGTFQDCGGLRFLGVPQTAGVLKTGIYLMRESLDQATMNFQSNGDGSWYCNEADGVVPASVKASPAWYDLTVSDAHGGHLRRKPAASEAECRATPNSFFNDTTATPDKLTIHRLDGAEPNPGVTDAYCEASNAYGLLPDDDEDVVLENFVIPVNTGAAALVGIYGRAKDITVPGPRVAHTGGVHLISCTIIGASSNGSINQDVNGYHFDTWFRDCRNDAVSGGTFYTYASVNTGDRTLEGRHLRLIFYRGGAYDMGENDFVGQPALSGSANLLTAHSQLWALGIDLAGRGFDGCPFAFVGASKALLLNCFANDVLISTPSQSALNLGSPPKALFWADGPSDGVPSLVTEVFMAYCGGEAGPGGYSFAATRGAIIKHARHRGPTTVLPGQTGTVTNVGA